MKSWKIMQSISWVIYMLLSYKGIEGQVEIKIRQVAPNLECGYVDTDDCCTNQNPECSWRDEIIGGDIAYPERFPYIVSLQITKDITNGCYYHFCGASLISPDVVLTAAHCIQEVAPTNKREGIMAIAVYASLAPRCRHGPSSIVGSPDRVKVAYYLLHPKYARYTLENDIAVLKLEEPLTGPEGPFARYKIGNGGLLEGATLNTYYQNLIVIGYGDTNADESKLKQYNLRHLRKANIQYLGDGACDNILNSTNTFRKLVPEKMMCAFNKTADACSGDSGGPLIVTGANGTQDDYATDLQVGIVSWGPNTACTNSEEQSVGVYTQLEEYGAWLDETIVQLDNIVQTPPYSENGSQDNTDNLCQSDKGCQCKSFWQYQGKSYAGCNNPDQDPSGSWCIVDVKQCVEPSGSISVTGEFWDTCKCIQADFQQENLQAKSNVECPTTQTGCKCKADWEHSGEYYKGCDNPDADPAGKWCHIQGDFDSCSNSDGVDQTFMAQRTVNDNSGNFLSYFDYCKEEC